jgi:hypothetical protein
MTKRILIAGNESALTSAIEVEAAKRVGTYTVALLPNRLSGDGAKIGFQTRQENNSSESSTNQEQEKGRGYDEFIDKVNSLAMEEYWREYRNIEFSLARNRFYSKYNPNPCCLFFLNLLNC